MTPPSSRRSRPPSPAASAIAAALLALALRAGAAAPGPASFEASGCASLLPRLRALMADLIEADVWRGVDLARRCARDPAAAPQERAEALSRGGRLKLAVGDAADAEEDLKEALRLAPEDAGTALALAQALRERPEEALAYAEQASRARPEALLLVSELKGDLGDRGGAEEAAAKALEASPEDLDALAAAARLKKAQPEEAETYAARVWAAARKAPPWRRGSAFRFAARLWLELGRTSRAVEGFKSALSVDPDDLEALRALVELKQSRPQEPILLREPPPGAEPSAPEAAGDAVEALRREVESSRAQGRRAEALELSRLLSQAAPEAPGWSRADAERLAARQLALLGDPEGAWRSLVRAMEIDGESLRNQRLLAELGAGVAPKGLPRNLPALVVDASKARLALDDPEGAEASLGRGLETLRDAPQLLAAQAELELSLGKPREALALSERLSAVAARETLADVAAWRGAEVGGAVVAEGERTLARAREEDRLGAAALSARALWALGRRPEAAAAAARMLEGFENAEAPERARALRRQAELFFALGDKPSAARSLSAASLLVPDDRDGLRRLIALELELDHPDRELAEARRLVAGGAARAEDYRLLSRIQRGLKDARGATQSLERALALEPGDPGTLRELAALELEAGRIAQARARPEQAAARGDAGSVGELARLELEQARPGPAAAQARRLVEASAAAPAAERAEAYRLLAKAESSAGDRPAAEASLKNAVEALPGGAAALMELVLLELETGKAREAADFAERLIQADLTAPAAERARDFELKARALRAIGEEDKAEAALRSAALLVPADPAPRMELAELRPSEAAALLGDCGAGPARVRARCLVLRGAGGGSRADFAAAGGLDAAAACAPDVLSERRAELPASYFDECLRAFPAEARLYLDRGVARYRSGVRAESLDDFRRAVALRPDFPEAQLSLVSALAPWDRAEALAAADRALTLFRGRSGPLYDRIRDLRDSLDAPQKNR